MEFRHAELANGLTVIGELNHSARSAAVGFFVKTGARDETPQISGVSHFLEHMVFKGTDSLSALEVNEAFDRTGARFNASTSEENTIYYAAVLPEYLDHVVDLWTGLMKPSLRSDDFNMEKKVILEEIAMYKDNPQFYVLERARELYFAGHPCGNSVLGTNKSISAMTSEQMRDYFHSRYSPDNMILACCGNFDFDRLHQLALDKCRSWQPAQARRNTEFHHGKQQKKRIAKKNLVREHICIVSPAVSAQDPRRFAASLLAIIIGDDTGSRFFWAMVDNALAETASTQYESMDGTGAMFSYIRCSPENTTKVLDIMNKTFTSVISDGITEDELSKARNKVLSALTIRSEQPMGRLVDLGFNWVYLQQYRTLADDINSIKTVTIKEINSLLAEFSPADFTQFSIAPTKA